jgi:hypothetical protein
VITLNQDKELVRVSAWEDIANRPGFTAPLDPASHKLKGIIGQYTLAHDVPCGLSSCRTLHRHGYLVVTQSGHETNLGKDCGKRYFEVEFEAMRNAFDRDLRAKEQRERLYSLKFQIDEWRVRIDELRVGPSGADSTWRSLRAFREAGRGVPDSVVYRLRTMLKTGATLVEVDREATEDEVARVEATQGRHVPRPYHVSEPVGELRGLHALQDEMDLRVLLVVGLSTELDQFEHVAIDSLSPNELGRWAKWATGMEAQLERAVTSLDAARVFLDRDNLMLLSRSLTKAEERAEFGRYLRTLATTN